MTATTLCFYAGTPESFAADAASATSKKGTFLAATSGYATLNAAVVAGALVKAVTPAELAGEMPGFLWTLANQ